MSHVIHGATTIGAKYCLIDVACMKITLYSMNNLKAKCSWVEASTVNGSSHQRRGFDGRFVNRLISLTIYHALSSAASSDQPVASFILLALTGWHGRQMKKTVGVIEISSFWQEFFCGDLPATRRPTQSLGGTTLLRMPYAASGSVRIILMALF